MLPQNKYNFFIFWKSVEENKKNLQTFILLFHNMQKACKTFLDYSKKWGQGEPCKYNLIYFFLKIIDDEKIVLVSM